MAPDADDAKRPGGSFRPDKDEPLETKIARRYAHFHRVLGELLLELSERERTFWMTSDRHRLSAGGEENRYAKAVYVLAELAPYDAKLAELRAVQAEALDLIGNSEPTQSLLIPKVCQQVEMARILENTGFSSRKRKRADVLARLARQLETARAAQATFETFAARGDKRREIEREANEIETGLAALAASDASDLREHYRYPRYMCHVYYEDPDAFDQLYVGDVGIILQGRRAEVHRHDPKRRKHRRTKGIEPIVTVGPYVFYDEKGWREARKRS